MTNFQLQDNFMVSYTVNEIDADNNPAAPGAGDTCSVSSDNPCIVVQPDNPPKAPAVASGFLLGTTTLGTANITATPVHADGSPVAPPSTIAVDCVAGAAVSAGFQLGTPVPQTPSTPAAHK